MLVVLIGVLAFPATALREWPQFRGPTRDGRAPAPADGIAWPPREVWRVPAGGGFSGLTVAGPSIYTLFAEGGREHLARFAAADGREIWRLDVGPVFEETWGDGPRSTPAVSDGLVVALGGHGRLVVAETESGELRWSHELSASPGAETPAFGWSPSPLVDQGLVLLETGGEGLVTAFDLETGAPRWRALSGQPGYSSPVRIEQEGVASYVFQTRTELAALGGDGSVQWRWPLVGGSPIDLPIAMPVALGKGAIFSSHRAEGGAVAVEPGGSAAKGSKLRERWQSRAMMSHLSTPVLVGGVLYGFHNATLRAVSAATGDALWSKRGLGKGSLVAVGDELLVLADDGRLLRVEASSEAYRELGQVEILRGKSWTAPSVTGDRIYLRNQSEMVCLSLVAKKAPP